MAAFCPVFRVIYTFHLAETELGLEQSLARTDTCNCADLISQLTGRQTLQSSLDTHCVGESAIMLSKLMAIHCKNLLEHHIVDPQPVWIIVVVQWRIHLNFPLLNKIFI